MLPKFLFGLRLWAAVCLALYIAFWLELDNAYWAGASAAAVCQPILGASLRKGSFRMIGTIVGAVAIVALTACFPQNGPAFLLGLALWGGACTFLATLLNNFATYAAALAGFTAAIIASDQFDAVGGLNGDAFMLAVTRASEICIGIVCAGVVTAGTDFGGARRRLAIQLAALAAEIAERFGASLSLVGAEQASARPLRHGLVARVVALNPVIDQAIGEASDLRSRRSELRAAIDGLFAVLSGWRAVANCLEWLPRDQGKREADLVLQCLPQELHSAFSHPNATIWKTDPAHLRRACGAAARTLVARAADTPSHRLLADGAAEALLGMSRVLDGLMLLTKPLEAVPRRNVARFHLPDLLPALINAARAFLTIAVVELFWIATAWPHGATAVIWASIVVILFSPRDNQAYATAKAFMLGVSLMIVVAAIVKFTVLPLDESFAGFSLAVALVLIPVGALAAQPWQTTTFVAMAALFVPLLAPANQATYDTAQFYNSAVAIFAGMSTAALAILLLPPLSPAARVRRILALTLRDLRRLAKGKLPAMTADWEGRVYRRFVGLPAQLEPLQLAWLVATLSIGTEIVRLRRTARRCAFGTDLDAALDALARGDCGSAVDDLARIDRGLAAGPVIEQGALARLRARGSILVISETLARHRAYFDALQPS